MYVCASFFRALMLLVGQQEGHLACKKTQWWGAGVVICMERGADLHMAQLMLLPLAVSCFSKIQIGFTFLVPAHQGSPGQRAGKWVCVCVCHSVARWQLLQPIRKPMRLQPLQLAMLAEAFPLPRTPSALSTSTHDPRSRRLRCLRIWSSALTIVRYRSQAPPPRQSVLPH